MTPEYILRASLCREPVCAGPYELRDLPFAEWPEAVRSSTRRDAEQEIEDMVYASDYAERGYSAGPKGILFANWNHFSNDVERVLEAYGYSLEWSDEWAMCDYCGKAFRTQPDSYGWQPSGMIARSCECVCVECIDEDLIATEYENKPRRAFNLAGADLSQFGYCQIEGDFETGWHPGQNDDPQDIFDRLQAAGRDRLVFQIDNTGQFDVRFSVWEKIGEA